MKYTRRPLLLMTVLAACSMAGPVNDNPTPVMVERETRALDVAHPEGLPATGLWMLDQAGAPAHWLGFVVRGRSVRETLNVILVDRPKVRGVTVAVAR